MTELDDVSGTESDIETRLGYAYSINSGYLRAVVMAVGGINLAMQSLITSHCSTTFWNPDVYEKNNM